MEMEINFYRTQLWILNTCVYFFKLFFQLLYNYIVVKWSNHRWRRMHDILVPGLGMRLDAWVIITQFEPQKMLDDMVWHILASPGYTVGWPADGDWYFIITFGDGGYIICVWAPSCHTYASLLRNCMTAATCSLAISPSTSARKEYSRWNCSRGTRAAPPSGSGVSTSQSVCRASGRVCIVGRKSKGVVCGWKEMKERGRKTRWEREGRREGEGKISSLWNLKLIAGGYSNLY